jgi:hypothetical protein
MKEEGRSKKQEARSKKEEGCFIWGLKPQLKMGYFFLVGVLTRTPRINKIKEKIIIIHCH